MYNWVTHVSSWSSTIIKLAVIGIFSTLKRYISIDGLQIRQRPARYGI